MCSLSTFFFLFADSLSWIRLSYPYKNIIEMYMLLHACISKIGTVPQNYESEKPVWYKNPKKH